MYAPHFFYFDLKDFLQIAYLEEFGPLSIPGSSSLISHKIVHNKIIRIQLF